METKETKSCLFILTTAPGLTAFSGTTDNYSWNSNEFVMQIKWTTRPPPRFRSVNATV